LSTAAKGTLHRETILADGSVANTRVSARILKKQASKHQRMDPHFPPAEGDECKSMDEDWDDNDFSSLSTLQLEMFPNPSPGDDGDEPEEEDDEDMHSYAAAAGYQNEPPPDVASLSSGALPDLGAVVHDPLEAALERLPTLLDYESSSNWSLTRLSSKSLAPTPALTWWLRGWRQPSATTPSKTSRNCQNKSP
jgi:hypothetical protein